MTIQVYVGTYAKYNNGDLTGEWVDLEKFSDLEDFESYCFDLHSDEDDPEFMFQDYENIPECYISESRIDADLWDWINLDDDDRAMYEAAIYCFGDSITLEQAQDAFQGQYRDDIEFAQEFAESCGLIDESLSWPHNCIDWEYAAREIMYDYSEHNGYYFNSNW